MVVATKFSRQRFLGTDTAVVHVAVGVAEVTEVRKLDEAVGALIPRSDGTLRSTGRFSLRAVLIWS